MEKFDVGRSIAPGLQGSLPGFPVVEEEHGRSARKRSLTDRSRARRACAPMGTLVSIVVSRDARNERRVWYVVEPDMQLAPQYAAQGTKNVSENITGVKADADTAAGAAENVKQASELLETQSQQLGHQVSDFLGKIRAA